MRTMRVFFVQVNRFAGTLPDRAVARLEALAAFSNDFEGKVSQTQSGQCIVVMHHPLLDQKLT
eukprot:5755615-Amphidinium_carterae.1